MKSVIACAIITKPKLQQLLALTAGVGLLELGALAADRLVATASQFTTALGASQPGDTITLTDLVWQNVDLLFKNNGTTTNPITLRAQSPGGVIISGDSRLRVAGNWLVVVGLRFLTWARVPGLPYHVQYSSNAVNCLPVGQAVSKQLTTSTWTDNSSLTGGPPGSRDARFYRIALTP